MYSLDWGLSPSGLRTVWPWDKKLFGTSSYRNVQTWSCIRSPTCYDRGVALPSLRLHPQLEGELGPRQLHPRGGLHLQLLPPPAEVQGGHPRGGHPGQRAPPRRGAADGQARRRIRLFHLSGVVLGVVLHGARRGMRLSVCPLLQPVEQLEAPGVRGEHLLPAGVALLIVRKRPAEAAGDSGDGAAWRLRVARGGGGALPGVVTRRVPGVLADIARLSAVTYGARRNTSVPRSRRRTLRVAPACLPLDPVEQPGVPPTSSCTNRRRAPDTVQPSRAGVRRRTGRWRALLGREGGAGLPPGPPRARGGAGFTCSRGELAVRPQGHGAFVPTECVGANWAEQPRVRDEGEEDSQ